VVRLHASCIAVRPFARWFRQDGGTRAAVWLLLFRVSSHDMWDPALVSQGGNPGARRWRLCPWRLRMRVGRAAFKKGSIPWAVAMPSHSPHASRPSTFRAPRWGAPALPSSCCCWRSTTSWGLALFSHRSASRIFITQSAAVPCRQSPRMMTAGLVVGKSEPTVASPLSSASRTFIVRAEEQGALSRGLPPCGQRPAFP
jgi:hypothetical protein